MVDQFADSPRRVSRKFADNLSRIVTITTMFALVVTLLPGSVPAWSADPGVSAEALVLHLPFDEIAGSEALDVSGSGHHSALKRGAVFDPESGVHGGAVRFDGDRSYVGVPDSPDLNLETVTHRTISLWFRAEDPSIADRKQVLWEEGGTSKGMSLYLHDGLLYVGAWNGSTEFKWKGTFVSTGDIQPGRWHHAALVLQGESNIIPNALRGYLDGALFATGPAAEVYAHGSIGIGQINGAPKFHDGNRSGDHGLAGHIDDVRVYNRTLHADEIAILAAGGGDGPPANRAPIADAGPDLTVAPGGTVQLDGSGSTDPDDGPSPLAYLWEQVSGPPVTIDGASNPIATVTLNLADTYVFRLTVDDGELQDTDQVAVRAIITPNTPPIADAGPDLTVAPGGTVQLDGSGSTDPDDGPSPLAYLWEQVSGPPVTIDGASNPIATVTLNLADTYVFRLTVDDGELQDTDQVAVRVQVAQSGVAAAVPSTDLSALTRSPGEWDTNNQRRSWWNAAQGRWDAILPVATPPAAGPSHWWLVMGVAEASPTFALEVNAGTSVRPDVFWDQNANELFVLENKLSKTTFKRYGYDPSTDTYSLEVSDVLVPGTDVSGSRATIYRTPNGHLWSSMMNSGSSRGLWINRSTDGGATWSEPIQLLVPSTQGQTSLVHFEYGGTTYLAVAAAEDGKADDSKLYFLFVDQDNPAWNTRSAWTDETSSVPPFQGDEHMDDEVSVARDAVGNIYIVAETEPGPSGSNGMPQLVLYRRTVSGDWSQVTIASRQKGVRGRKRPTVVVDGATNALYVFSINQDRSEVSYVTAPLVDIDELANAPMTIAIQEDGKQFRNNVTPRFETDGASGILVLIDNLTDGTIWQRWIAPSD